MKPTATASLTSSPILTMDEKPACTAIVPAESPQPPAPAPENPPALFALQFPTRPLAPSQLAAASKKKRNGKIAQLPKAERDMVNLMLRNNQPHHLIAGALDYRGYTVTPRNISNWKTRGGYAEWCAAQAQALELRTFQDNLTDFLRRHDAAELSEVGLQSAATNLSAILLRPDLMRELLADPDKYSKLIALQCRLAREIQALQLNRDEVSTAVGGSPERLKRENEREIEKIRKTHSSKYDKEEDYHIPHHNFIPKQVEPVKTFTYSEKDALRRFQSLFQPKPAKAQSPNHEDPRANPPADHLQQ